MARSIHRIVHLSSLLFVAFVLSACGGGSGGISVVSPIELPDQPQNVVISLGDSQVTLSWSDVSNANAYKICQAQESIVDVDACLTYLGGILHTDITQNTYTITGLTNGDTYYFMVTAVNSDDAAGTASSEISATIAVTEAESTGVLNDTGLTTCGDYAISPDYSGNFNVGLDCDGTDPDSDLIPEGQDALYGRDALYNDDSDGHAGFSFTKLDEAGYALAASATSWNCVKDNVTGLIWEVKTDDGGLRDKDNTYLIDDADDYVLNVNATDLCGADDWYLPTIGQLQSLSDLSTTSPAIDTDYFPNTMSSYYWSSFRRSSSGSGSYANWVIDFDDSEQSPTYWTSAYYYLRLVRSGE